MKFKKTKLTALAMSVLMAASTITSVTWAADLFTDGAPAEVAVEAPVEVVSSEGTEEPMLTDAVTFRYGNPRPGDGINGVIKDSTGYYLKNVTVDVYDIDELGAETKRTDPMVLSRVDVTLTKNVEPASCQHPKRTVCDYTIENNSTVFHAYFVEGEILKHEDLKGEGKVVPIEGSETYYGVDCEKYEKYIAYYVCPGCGYVLLDDGTVASFKTVTFQNYNDRETDPAYEHVIFKEMETKEAGHDWKRNVIGVIPPDNLKGERKTEDAALKVFDIAKNSDKVKYYQERANCEITNGTIKGKLRKDDDAYYYEYDECQVCHKTEGIRRDLNNVDKIEAEEIYKFETGGNIYKWLITDSNGRRYTVDGNVTNGYNWISATKYNKVDVVLNNCQETGVYYRCKVDKDQDPIVVETIYKDAGHSLSNIQINTKTTNVNDLTTDGKWTSVKVTRDENYNVTSVQSKNCSTEATYELERVCLNPFCGYRDPDVGGKTKCAPGPHVWTYVGKDLKVTYEQVDELHHMEYYYDDVKCSECGKYDVVPSTKTPSAMKDHKFAPAEIKDTRKEPDCGNAGSYDRADTCPCGYINMDTKTTVTIPATDQHKFEGDAFLEWSGEVYIADERLPKRSFHVDVVRKCSVCGKTDSNGINTTTPTVDDNEVDLDPDVDSIKDDGKYCVHINVDPKSIVDAKKDPSTGVTYPCSTAHATIYVDWVGTVDGKVVKLNSTTTTNAVKENVPYYASMKEYDGRTAHHKAPAVKEKVTPTSYDEVIYCEVCGDEISRKTVTVTPEAQINAPTVTATAVNYNTVNVSWTPVEGATSYRLYYRSADLGITTWHRVRTLTGTSFTHSGLTTGARYRYTVRAEVNGKLGDYSRTGSVARPLPAAPEMKSVTAVSNGTKVTWSKVDGADGYIIFRKTTGAFTRVGSVSKGSKVTWTDKKPVSGATYKVRAYRTVDNVNYKGAFSAAK